MLAVNGVGSVGRPSAAGPGVFASTAAAVLLRDARLVGELFIGAPREGVAGAGAGGTLDTSGEAARTRAASSAAGSTGASSSSAVAGAEAGVVGAEAERFND